ncbi:hypothetical protein QUF90_10900 [Desulfococcaceae bacterium HSG9]|nr:hypothetical protein [Desulfococcaceae bacterium HSG9]
MRYGIVQVEQAWRFHYQQVKSALLEQSRIALPKTFLQYHHRYQNTRRCGHIGAI